MFNVLVVHVYRMCYAPVRCTMCGLSQFRCTGVECSCLGLPVWNVLVRCTGVGVPV
jgi:hypothetical protein